LVAGGKKLSCKQEDVIFRGHVIECRINAEDPYKDFIPVPGTITGYHVPQGLGVRIDSHCYVDYTIPPNYDSMVAKLIVWGLNRREAIARTRRSLDEFIIEGIYSTIPFHQQVMKNKSFLEGKFNTGFLNTFKMK
ncbi:MAG TPA: acetyl-CoA carboxylase biotin carboxylase subunit, partial [Spirochaetota bacterium]|nr:acetyl-CoA carboxylase biotin carboxylase subunit [Spirochaetota bacterium]